MASITVEGKRPLVGELSVSGAKNAALKIIFASLFSNEDVILENVPRVTSVLADLELIRAIGGTATWTGTNTVSINGANINSYEIPYEVGSQTRTALLLAGPLLYRFGKVRIPKYSPAGFNPGPLNRYFATWESFGIAITEAEDYFELDASAVHASDITFTLPTHMGTDSAIMSALFLDGETYINNASEEVEVDELIEFCNSIGADVSRVEPRRILVRGTNIFKGSKYRIGPDKTEVAVFTALALLTNGNIIIKETDRAAMIPFVNFLTKLGARFEFADDGLKVWHDGSLLKGTDVTIAPTPGLVPDWKPLITLLLLMTEGESLIHDTVYVNRNNFVPDLNRMGAGIEIVRPSEVGLTSVISDDSYDVETMGEAPTVLKVTGPKKLRGERLHIEDPLYGAVLVLAALFAEGKSYVSGIENLDYHYEGFVEKLRRLGAKLSSYELDD